MFRPLALAVLALTLVPTLAEARIGGAVCRIGQGCVCIDFADTGLAPVLAEHADLLGDTTPEDIVIIDRSTNTTFRTRRSPAQVHASFGGSGECPVTAGPGEIIPNDGLWRLETGAAAVSSCPDGASDLLFTRLDQLMQTTRVVWNGRFDPSRFADGAQAQAFRWREGPRQRWVSDRLGDRTCTAGICSDMNLRMWMTPVSPDRVRGHLRLMSQIEGGGPEVRAALARFGMDRCQVYVEFQVDRIGN